MGGPCGRAASCAASPLVPSRPTTRRGRIAICFGGLVRPLQASLPRRSPRRSELGVVQASDVVLGRGRSVKARRGRRALGVKEGFFFRGQGESHHPCAKKPTLSPPPQPTHIQPNTNPHHHHQQAKQPPQPSHCQPAPCIRANAHATERRLAHTHIAPPARQPLLSLRPCACVCAALPVSHGARITRAASSSASARSSSSSSPCRRA